MRSNLPLRPTRYIVPFLFQHTMAVQSETFRPQTVQYVAPKPQQAEAVYIHSVFHLKHDQYKGRLSLILGIILIVLQTLAIILNIIGVVLQHHRNDDRPFWKGNLAFATFPSIWCGIFVSIACLLVGLMLCINDIN